MNIRYGNRKFAAFCLVLCVYLIITLAVLITSVIMNKEGKSFDVISFAGLFIPLGSGLAAICVFFFSANAAEHFANKNNNK